MIIRVKITIFCFDDTTEINWNEDKKQKYHTVRKITKM
jgi:hypothetical protein